MSAIPKQSWDNLIHGEDKVYEIFFLDLLPDG